MIHIHGDGGHAKVVRDVLAQVQFLRAAAQQWDEAFLSGIIIAVGDNKARQCEAKRYMGQGREFASCLVHPRTYVADNCQLGEGSIVMAGAVIQPNCKLGRHCIVNTNSSIDHDCIIGDYAHIAPGAVLCGGVTVGEGALIGAGAVCVPGAVIKPWTLVKAGSVAK